MEDIVLLDTGVLFNFLADKEDASITEKILKEGKAAISTITIFELFRGVISKTHLQQRNQLASFLHKIEISEHIARKAGMIYTSLKSNGTLIDNEDILIGATALYHSIPVFTVNSRHFKMIPNLRLYTH